MTHRPACLGLLAASLFLADGCARARCAPPCPPAAEPAVVSPPPAPSGAPQASWEPRVPLEATWYTVPAAKAERIATFAHGASASHPPAHAPASDGEGTPALEPAVPEPTEE